MNLEAFLSALLGAATALGGQYFGANLSSRAEIRKRSDEAASQLRTLLEELRRLYYRDGNYKMGYLEPQAQERRDDILSQVQVHVGLLREEDVRARMELVLRLLGDPTAL